MDFVDHRVGIFGDVGKLCIQCSLGVGKTTLLQSFIKNTDRVHTFATDGVDYSEKLIVKDTVCHRFIFCDFSGQQRLYPVLKGYMKSIQAAILVADITDPSSMKYILYKSYLTFLHGTVVVFLSAFFT